MVGNRILPNENQTAARTQKTMWLPLDIFLLRERCTSQEKAWLLSLSSAKEHGDWAHSQVFLQKVAIPKR